MSSKVTKIQIKRGLETNLPTLSAGEPAFTTDQKNFYIGDGSINQRYLKTTGDTMTGGLTIEPDTDTLTALVVNDTDSNNVFTVDTVNNWVGIWTTAPGSRLVIKGSSATSATSALNVTNSSDVSALFVRDDGNVGIDTTSPTSRLHVVGSSSVASVGVTNLLTADGTFDTSAGWTVGDGWTIGTSVATHATGNTAALSGTSTVSSTSTVYQVNFTVAVTTAGDGFSVSLGGNDSGTTFNSAGAQTVYISPTSGGVLAFTPGTAGTFVGTIDAVTIYAMTGSTPDAMFVNSDGTSNNLEMRAGGSGTQSLFIGLNAGQFNTTTGGGDNGKYNTFIGNNAGRFNTTGSYNTANGIQALYSNTTGSYNTANGVYALYDLKPTSKAISAFADYSATVAGKVLATSATHGRTTGDSLIISGTVNYNGTYTVTVVDVNTFYFTKAWVATETGWWTLAGQTGSSNTAFGYNTGRGITYGSGNTILGASVTGLAPDLTNNIILASGGTSRAQFDGTNWNFSGKMGVNTISPSYALDVNGDINISSASAYYVGTVAGVSGTFTTADAKTVTVVKGIITSIV